MARRLASKDIVPFTTTVLKDGATNQLDLSELPKRGTNRSFHASLILKPHVPNDDKRFPGRLPSQIQCFGKQPDEWVQVDSIVFNHQEKEVNSERRIRRKVGDHLWAPYHKSFTSWLWMERSGWGSGRSEERWGVDTLDSSSIWGVHTTLDA